jgi:hypothetical protein
MLPAPSSHASADEAGDSFGHEAVALRPVAARPRESVGCPWMRERAPNLSGLSLIAHCDSELSAAPERSHLVPSERLLDDASDPR